MTTLTDSKTVADAYFAAYNAGDLTALGAVMSDDITFDLNRSAMRLKGKAEVLAMLGEVQKQFPDRRFEPGPTEITSDGLVVVDHTWAGTAAADAPDMGVSQGDVLRQEVVTVLTVSEGLVVEYRDFNYA